MVKKISPSVLCSLALLVAAVWSAHGQELSLEDALDDVPTVKPKPQPKPPSPPKKKTDDFDLSDFFDPTPPPKVVPKVPPRRPDFPMTTRKPRPSTNKPHKKPGADDFDLSDALNDNNDPKGKDPTIRDKDKPSGGGASGTMGRDASEDLMQRLLACEKQLNNIQNALNGLQSIQSSVNVLKEQMSHIKTAIASKL